MRILVTGGAGFIGRWVVKKLLLDGHDVWVLDNLSNGCYSNIEELDRVYNNLIFIKGDILDLKLIRELFENKFDICFHLAASINVQDSIDNPKRTFENDTVGAFNVLQECKNHGVKMVFMSTCMVYDMADNAKGINEEHPTKPASPYAGSKIAAENLVLSYFYAYSLPVTVVRPFNTYGPFQKSSGEGGVVSIFISNKLQNKNINIYGDGKQTRDLLYVEDCADFVVKAGYSQNTNGQIINAGYGKDISINDLACYIMKDEKMIEHVKHIHPQSEIKKLLCDYSKADKLLNWKPQISIEQGIKKTTKWMLHQLK